jgi:hypothetical protein
VEVEEWGVGELAREPWLRVLGVDLSVRSGGARHLLSFGAAPGAVN